jgi:hypothetical protein
MRTYKPLPAILFAVCTAAAAHAQTGSMSIPAWVETNNCSSAPKFEAELNGKAAPVARQLGPSSDQIILLVLDLTGDLSLIDIAKKAVVGEVSKLPKNAWVGLLRAQDGLRVLADPSANRQPLINAIQTLSSGGEPGLLDTVPSALSLADAMMRKSPVRVSVLYVTDSNIYNYRDDYTNPVINQSDPHDLSRRFPDALISEKVSELVTDLGSLEAPLFVVHINYQADPLNEAYQNGLQTLAGATGGKSDVCRSMGEIPDVISGTFARISNAWRLMLTIPPNFHSDIQIRLSAPCPEGDSRLSWRTHFHPKEG